MDAARKNAPASNGKSSRTKDAKYTTTKVHKHVQQVERAERYEIKDIRGKDKYENVHMKVHQRAAAQNYAAGKVVTHARTAAIRKHEVKYENAHMKVHQRTEVQKYTSHSVEMRARKAETMPKSKREAKHGNEDLRITLRLNLDAKVEMHVRPEAAMQKDKALKKKLMGN